MVEAWAAKAPEGADSAASVSVNRTPIAAEFQLDRDKTDLDLFGCGLNHTVAKTTREVTLWLNVMTPYMPITSDGKEPDLEPFIAGIADAAGKRSESCGAAASAARPQKDVVFDHLAEVIELVSGPERYRFNDRQLFYRMRPIVLDETGKELKLGNWKSILDAYEEENGEIPLMYREPRGSITHPHSRRDDHARHADGRAIRAPGMELQQAPLHREGGRAGGPQAERVAGAARLRGDVLQGLLNPRGARSDRQAGRA